MQVQDPYKPTRLALQGFDVVYYLGHFRAVQGKPQFKAKHKGKTYVFCTEENLKLFKRNPEMFSPRFDGHCALTYALKGKLVPGLPTFSNVVGDHVYLYSKPSYARFCKLFPNLLDLAEARYQSIVADVVEDGEEAISERPVRKPVTRVTRLMKRLLGIGAGPVGGRAALPQVRRRLPSHA